VTEDQTKSLIEKLVLEDLAYISNYKPVVKNRISIQDFLKMSVIKPIAQNVYPQLYTDLISRCEPDEAIRRLKNTGRRLAKYFYSVFPDILKKPQKFDEIILNVPKSHLHKNLQLKDKVIENSRIQSCIIEIKNCFFCSGIDKIEDLDIPYCTALAGFYENLYNIKSLGNQNLNPRLIEVTSISSASDERDLCEYKLIAID